MSDVLAWGGLLSVSIGGSNRTADLTGQGEVDRELDAAGIAVFRLGYGAAKPTVGQSVSISGIVGSAYSGVVSSVAYDASDRVWIVQCSDQLQEQFESLADEVAVVALLPSGAIWHKDLYGEFSDGWEAAQDAMSTIPYSIYMEGGLLHSVEWAGTGYSSTIAHSTGGIYDGSVTLQEATSREMISSLTATVGIRYSRLHHWTLSVAWTPDGDWDFCAWMEHPWGLPTRQMVAEVATGNSWTLMESGGLWSSSPDDLGINTDGLPKSGVYCGQVWELVGSASEGGFIWMNKMYDSPANMVYQGSWKMGRRWSQTIEETYTLTVKGSTGTVGAVLADERASHESPSDDTGWDASQANRLPIGFTWNISQGHRWSDQLVAANRTLVIQGMLGMLATRIRASQRRTTMSVAVEPGSEPGLGTRCRIAAEDIDRTGQVISLFSSWDTNSHNAQCLVTISVSSGSTSGDDLTVPTPPVVTPTAGGYTLDSVLHLDTYIGRKTGAVEQEEDWIGWITNVIDGVDTTMNLSGPVYNEGFVLVTPDVPNEARDTQTGTVTSTYTIDPLD